MGRYTSAGMHMNEMLGKRGTTDPHDCTYCHRAWSEGFLRCPTCEHPFGCDPMTCDEDAEPDFPDKSPGVVMDEL